MKNTWRASDIVTIIGSVVSKGCVFTLVCVLMTGLLSSHHHTLTAATTSHVMTAKHVQLAINQFNHTLDPADLFFTRIVSRDGAKLSGREVNGQVSRRRSDRRSREARSGSDGAAGQQMSPRVRQTQSGAVRGLLLTPLGSGKGGRVETYLGMQYASLLGGELRFMPPTSPTDTWQGVREARTLAPVCPQRRPDLRQLESRVPTGYLHHIHRLLTFTELQAEDCLYLNIYVPLTTGADTNDTLLPVAVFILTENYDMGTPNMYDGSILAAHGNIVIVTVNFRLGPLGFLSTADDSASGNYALMDIVAALHWVQANIAAFNGQPGEVTLVGQGYGSALVHLLLISPLTKGKGLFKRVIVQSGSAYASWAVVKKPLVSATQLASKVNCSSQDSGHIVQCLRGKSHDVISSVEVTSYKYLSTWGPVVDGSIVVHQSVDTATESALASGALHDVTLLLGHMRDEGLLYFNQSQLERGMRATAVRRVMNTYVRNTYVYKRQTLLDVLLHYYTDWQRPEDAHTSRDSVMDMLGDGQWTAPLVHLAQRSSYAAMTTFAYVMHAPARTHLGYPVWASGVRGDDVTFLFGQPLTSDDVAMYSESDKRLSECLMTYWCNFISSGNPNWPQKAVMNEEDGVVQWPLYDSHEQQYLHLGQSDP